MCSRCRQEKPDTEFNKKKGTKLQPYCKSCQSVWFRSWYAQNQQKEIQRVQVIKQRRVAEAVEEIEKLKQAPCADCKRTFPRVAMDFDHVKGLKFDNVSRMMRQGYSLKRIREEIAKCEVVCACCHRVRTANRKRIGV